MSRKRNASEIELNFDGLTDSVTNLVGVLILLVVLLVGVTSSKALSLNAERSESSGTKKVEELIVLQRATELLRIQIANVDQQISKIEAELPELESKVNNLIGQVTATKK